MHSCLLTTIVARAIRLHDYHEGVVHLVSGTDCRPLVQARCLQVKEQLGAVGGMSGGYSHSIVFGALVELDLRVGNVQGWEKGQ